MALSPIEESFGFGGRLLGLEEEFKFEPKVKVNAYILLNGVGGKILPSCASLQRISKAQHDKLLFPFKGHPKLLDAGALRRLAGKPSQNLPLLMVLQQQIKSSFLKDAYRLNGIKVWFHSKCHVMTF